MSRTLFLLALTFVGFSMTANAQYAGALGSTWNNPVSALSNVQMWNNINNASIRRTSMKMSLRKYGCTDDQMNALNDNELMIALSKKSCTVSGAGRNSSVSTASSMAASSTVTNNAIAPVTFMPSGGRIILPQIVMGITQDKAEQKALIKLIGGAIDQFEAAQRAKGSEYDLASAMSFFASISIYLQDTSTEMNSAGGDALTMALREAIGTKAASISNSDKQQFYEALLSFGMLFALSSKNADANTLATLKQTSAELSQKLIGLDVTRYRFTSDGLTSIR